MFNHKYYNSYSATVFSSVTLISHSLINYLKWVCLNINQSIWLNSCSRLEWTTVKLSVLPLYINAIVLDNLDCVIFEILSEQYTFVKYKTWTNVNALSDFELCRFTLIGTIIPGYAVFNYSRMPHGISLNVIFRV